MQADLFINTCELQLCGQLLSSSLLSCFGENAYSEGAATPSTELQVLDRGKKLVSRSSYYFITCMGFLSSSVLQVFTAENLVALQQRAPTPLGREVAFADELVQWISDSKFKQVSQNLLSPCRQELMNVKHMCLHELLAGHSAGQHRCQHQARPTTTRLSTAIPDQQ